MKNIFLFCLFMFFIMGSQAQVVKKESNKKSNLNPVKLGDPNTKSSKYLAELIKKKTSNYIITSEHISSISGTRHIYLKQAINGVGIIGTESSLHIAENGEILASHNNFLNEINKTVLNSEVSISAKQAIIRIAQQMNYTISNLKKLEKSKENNLGSLFNAAGISKTEIPTKLMYYYQENIGINKIWEISIQEKNSSDWWNFRVDATTGLIIDKDNWTLSCNVLGDHKEHKHKSLTYDIKPVNENVIYKVESEPTLLVGSYNVYAIPTESPNHGGRTNVTSPDDATASPYGWHDTNGVSGAEYTITRGNNVFAYEDGDNSGFSPDGTNALSFDFAINTNYSNGDQSESAAITNLFYWNNIVHDVMYQHGFDEASGNFQENNYGNGGAGSDSVNAEAQDGSGTCNANFGTPSDGGNPTMQMYVCGSRDGDLDNGVIIHEYGHGISNRLTGGPAASNCLNNTEQMGEGWSDFFGMIMTIEPSDAGVDSRGMGTWLIGEGANGPGIRTHPYSTNFAINPHTYDDIKTEVAPHGVGSVWAMMLWEMTWDLIAVYGVDSDIYGGNGGNNVSLSLVTEGLKLQPCSPGFVDGRDAILAADVALYGGANQCTIWEAFARRGLGHSATQGSTGSKTDGTEAFDLPPGTALFTNSIESLCITEGIQIGLNGGSPSGGTYSGLGVTDDGNGSTYTFNPSVGGVGITTITYTVNDSCTGGVVNLEDTIDVSDGNPLLSCQNTTVTLDGSGNASVLWQDVVSNIVPGGYTLGGITYNPVSMTDAATSVSLGDDNGTSAIPIGFDFEFYDITYTNFYIASNGFLSFTGNGMTGSASWTPTTIPNAAAPNGMIAGVWDDLSPNAGGTIKYETFDSSPNRKVVVEFSLVPLYFSSQTVTFQIQMYEGTNIIEVHFVDVQNNGGNRTFGIENETGTDALTDPVTNLGNWTASTEAFAFTPELDSFADNCGNSVSLSLNQSAFTCQDIGNVIVTVTANDGNGGVATCDAIVTIVGPTTTFASGSWDVTPNIGAKALFSDNYDTDNFGDVTACSCEVETGKTVTVNAGGYLEITGHILVDGILAVEHEGSLVQVDDTALVTNNGSITVEKITTPLDPLDFTILGSPMTGATRELELGVSTLVRYHDTNLFNPNIDVAAYDPLAENFADDNGDNWITHTGLLVPGEGYLVRPAAEGGTLTTTYSTGTLNNGVISFTALFGDDQNDSPNILSNPYASAIRIDDFLTANSIVGGTVYFWEHLTAQGTDPDYPGYQVANYDMGDISSRNGTGGLAAANGGSVPTNLLPSGQGFGIKASGTGIITFTNALRSTGPNTGYRKSETAIDRLYLGVSNNTYGLRSQTLIGFTELATDGFDQNYDSKRLATPISLYSLINEREFGIQGRTVFHEDQIIPLGFTTHVAENQEYKIFISTIEGILLEQATVYLKDNLLNTLTNLSETDYSFTSNEGHQTNRFELLFTEVVLGTPDVLQNIYLYPNPAQSQITIVSSENVVYNVKIYDIRGRQVLVSSFLNQGNYQIDISNLEAAFYFVEINTNTGSIIKRIIKE